MMKNALPLIVVVTRATRLDGLKARWATRGQAKFRMRQSSEQELMLRKAKAASLGMSMEEDELEEMVSNFANSQEYEDEDAVYARAVERLVHDLDFGFPIKRIDRSYLSTFDFERCVTVVVIGPDGLVANTAKYVGDKPLIGVNPDPQRIDGVLLPFSIATAPRAVRRAAEGRGRHSSVTLAQVETNDGQRMLAFNDFFIGAKSHVSARYTIEVQGRWEKQSSSGVLVCTGAGSTGWLSSMFNMANGWARNLGHGELKPFRLDREEPRLAWAVREPFASRNSQAEMVFGFSNGEDEITIASQMPQNGVIFSDGVESDSIEFNSGCIARISVARQSAKLVVG